MDKMSPKSQWIKCIATHGTVRGIGIEATSLVREMAMTHGLKGHGAKALGESVMGALLIASFCKQGERINLNIRGTGKVSQALVDAYPDGGVRGYIVERETLPVLDDASVGPWGHGLLSVLRTKGTEAKQPYIGTVPLLTGHLAKDLTFYWVQSEQIPSAVGLVVDVENDQVVRAGGFLVQVLPGASALEVSQIESHISDIHSLSAELAADADPLHLLSKIFQNTTFMVIEEKDLVFRCQCSWARVERSLALVGVAELQSMLEEAGEAIVNCDFCSKEYRVDRTKLKKMISDLSQAGDEA